MRPSHNHRSEAFTLIELLWLMACLIFVITLVLPALPRPARRSSRINCVNNLKQIGLSFRTWAIDNNDQYPPQVAVTNGGTLELINSGSAYVHFLVMSNELTTPKLLICPEEKDSRRIAGTTFGSTPSFIPVTNDLNVSYFVGVDANQSSPSMWLSGDRQISIGRAAYAKGLNVISSNTQVAWVKGPHRGGGNFCLADGSVTQTDNSSLQPLLHRSSPPTNRLAMP